MVGVIFYYIFKSWMMVVVVVFDFWRNAMDFFVSKVDAVGCVLFFHWISLPSF